MEIINGRVLCEGLAFRRIVIFQPHATLRIPQDSPMPVIVVADDLTPYDTVGFDKKRIAAIVVGKASTNAHVAILARVMDIPVITGIRMNPDWESKPAIVNALEGTLVIEPDDEERKQFETRKKQLLEQQESLKSYRNKKTLTPKGKAIPVYANIANSDDIDSVLANGAEGIGNFKTEFMYLSSGGFPTEAFQFEIYKNLALRMGDRKTIIRTLDIGVDKIPPYFNLGKEDNPALGYRAIRICLDHPEIFIPQLRAILRASVYGNLAIMYPMIVSEEEVAQIKSWVEQVKADLEREGIPFNNNMEQGIMIETPAAVIMSRELAKMVDFFSIGTNDLTQYTLAVDRHNPQLEPISNPYHPAVLRSIEYVIRNAHEQHIWVEISGEIASDLSMTKYFVENGIDALAVSPHKILSLRKAICCMDG